MGSASSAIRRSAGAAAHKRPATSPLVETPPPVPANLQQEELLAVHNDEALDSALQRLSGSITGRRARSFVLL